eukprot:CAMPEP_0206477662 /NCGR_PEP_ID=MMETSP0324_2-20121206/35544_1 /ASSEMBLY_ACC=CAM_ASM_000836 /TAXON_ID=2866 /ORGANISM="Crypthecodinium cohnii, Strain Seligo" /LENGTH=646 /DNA_ID=CAMNT_0053953725 /DNA_START=69 /DNA_END=2009 /DNA_ORIENTATION=+
MQLKVVLPSGEVNVPVEPNSTPGHLKENLKYSIRVPPKLIKLTCEGRELDDIKPLCAEPNNLVDGSIVLAEAREGVPDEPETKSEAKRPAEPTMIKKEEPPKPKKVKKDVVRPTLAEGDVVKKKVLSEGKKAWKPEWIEGKCEKRHMAFVRFEAVDEKKVYPDQDEGAISFAVGDPSTSPVWSAAVMQMKIGEKAQFQVPKKAVEYDLEGFLPSDFCATWNIELLSIAEALDVHQDYSQLMVITNPGGKDRAEDLDGAAVHWRIRRWTAEGMFCIASSRERIAIMPGYGLVPIEDQNAPPVTVSVGEGRQEAVEAVAMKCGPGGSGHLYLKTEALKGNRPQGCVIMDVEVVALDPNRGPGTSGWKGWQSLVIEREMGDEWLEQADGRRKQLETFGTLRKSTGDTKDAEAHVSGQVHKFANNAARRYRRVLKWIEMENSEDKKMKLEKCTVQMRLAKSSTLSFQRFGDAAEAAPSDEEKKAIAEALAILKEVLATGEELKNDNLIYEGQKMALQVHIQAEDVTAARQVLEKLLAMRPDDDELKSDSARINRLEGVLNLKKGANTIETVQKDLQAAITATDKEKVSELVGKLYDMIKGGEVTWDTVRTLKVGKDVGNAMKMGDPDIAASARKVVGEIQALAQRAGIGL